MEKEKALINNALKRYLSALKGPRALCEAMRYVVFSGGKRLRPIFVLEAAKTLKGSVKEALPFACAIELVHSCSLVHDDLPAMDDDDFRRGKPTCHKKFSEALAILAGDALLNLTFMVIADTKHEKANEIIYALSCALGEGGMMGGQAMDLEYNKRKTKDKKLKRKIDSMKTAFLMAVSCEIGAMLATSNKSYIKRMRQFGRNFGIAFQIKDDLDDSKLDKKSTQRMKKSLKLFTSKAKGCLSPFGKRADALRRIAGSIVYGKNSG